MGVDTREIITMWRTVGLLFVVTAASALPAQPAKQGKSFSLFSVVSFPNDECTTTMDPTMQGICKTTEECTEDGGTASGNCASGFGVCCFTTIEEAGAITNNITYIQNSGYPTAVGNTGTAASSTNQFTVTGGASICQVRLDFDTAVPSANDPSRCCNWWCLQCGPNYRGPTSCYLDWNFKLMWNAYWTASVHKQ